MASIGDIMKAKKEDRDPKKQEQLSPKKQKKVSIQLDTSLDKKTHKSHHKGKDDFNKGSKLSNSNPPKKVNKSKEATAAYNFIPFTRTVLASPLDAMRTDFRGYIQSQETYSGTLALELSNETSLFIGGDQKNDEELFFAPDGKPRIPGSTLRGMVRNLFKIITAGTMRRDEDFTDRHLYFRCIMAPNGMPQLKELNAYYEQRMVSDEINPETNRPKKNARPAFLYRLEREGAYYMAPCDMKFVPINELGYIRKSEVRWSIPEKKAYIVTGKQKDKKNVRYLFAPRWEDAEFVPDKILQDYRDDTRRKGVNLLEDRGSSKQQTPLRGKSAKDFAERDDIDFIVPCFYTKNEDGEITSFGHGRSYRIPYEQSIGDRLPAVLQTDPDIVDFADAVFGRKEDWAGRVSFEDACLKGPANLESAGWVKPLLGANPTSYQLYLTQNDWPPTHWDSDASVELRGYKMYWHKNIGGNDWKAKPEQQNANITKKIQPLSPGNSFSSAIHFRNLTAVELGALLKVFHLQQDDKEDIVYKLGMGKSLGMGSVRIKSSLHLDSDRYGNLFDGEKWQESRESADAQPFIEAFDTYVKDTLTPDEALSYQSSLKNLRIMLDWQYIKRPGWIEKVSAAGSDRKNVSGDILKQFTDRAVLPTPDKIIK
ncbi:TIGR03986 family CRISPR-associated RAMP protein [Megasphaera massiliensis]|uniref:TIGR03986 family type III CRISPR-associated RAMP protein n=1 Tax=Megasphaera massiliensis TaxID=1232428 RepID=UPI00210ACDD9|nr:TIGR03986 family CRISPR-associated RAMP protein [Megasphaera massiliensis]MCQ5209281.1 TIGR03986 family CRISPR-associated RAMP protein [Megasphaera massiliensis]